MRFKILALILSVFSSIPAGAQTPQEFFHIRRALEGSKAPSAVLPIRIFQNAPAQEGQDETKGALDSYKKLLKLIEEKYPNGTNNRDLRDGAVEGMLTASDRYAALLKPEVMKLLKQKEGLSDRGTGLIIKSKFDRYPPFVYFSIPGSSADAAGIKPGDAIVRIDGLNTTGMSYEAVLLRLSARKGEKIKVGVIAQGESLRSSPKEIELEVRQAAAPKIASEMIEAGVGYLSMENFTAGSAVEFKNALDALIAQGARSLVLDLRGNEGGSVDAAVAVASYFLPKNTEVISLKTNDGVKPITSSSDGAYQDLKLKILISQDTEGAAEILAGALKENKKAVLIGGETRGKASIQETFADIPEKGYGIRFATSKYLLPSGTAIDRDEKGKGGMKPDVAVLAEESQSTRLYSLRRGQGTQKGAKDPVMERALKELTSKREY